MQRFLVLRRKYVCSPLQTLQMSVVHEKTFHRGVVRTREAKSSTLFRARGLGRGRNGRAGMEDFAAVRDESEHESFKFVKKSTAPPNGRHCALAKLEMLYTLVKDVSDIAGSSRYS